jgi:putative ABC transport system permease protein
MRTLRALLVRMLGMLNPSRRERELAEEYESHLQMQTEDNLRAGMPADEARRQALMQVGGESAKELYRERAGLPWLETFVQDVRYGARTLRKNPTFTLIAVLTLALGIGVNAAMFSLADALVLRPLPVADPGTVMDISTTLPDHQQGGFSYPDYRDLREHARSFDGMVAFQLSTFSMARTRDEVAHMRMGMMVSDNFFSALGIQPNLGRAFLPEETRAASEPVVVLGHDFWNDQFNHDASVVGRTVRIAGMDFHVIGVAPSSFTGMDQYIRPSFFIPLAMAQRVTAGDKDPLEDRHKYGLSVDGRLRPGVSRRSAQAEIAALWQSLLKEYPGLDRNRGIVVQTQFQARVAAEPVDPYLAAALLALASIVLIIACANVANLLLGRARGRTREIAVRIALGVGRPRLLRQLMLENLVLALVGAVAGLAFAYGGIRFLQTIQVPTDLPVVIAPQLDQRVLLASLLAALASVLLFGLAPALQSAKTDLVNALKSGDASSSGKKRLVGRNVLVGGQIALSMVLLVAAGMLLDGFHQALAAGPGFRTDHLMMMEFDTALVHYKPDQSLSYYRELRRRAEALPGVTAVALTSSVPFEPGEIYQKQVAPEGYQFSEKLQSEPVNFAVIDEHYLDAVGIPIVAGRNFTAQDKADAPRVAIVNEQFAKRYWAGQDPVGKRIRLENAQGLWVQVVGVAQTAKYLFITETPQRFFYLPYEQDPRSQMAVLAKTSGDAAALAAPMREIVRAMDINQPIFNARTMADFFVARNDGFRMVMQLVGAMGLMGLALALIGIYGLVSYSVARRTREIGVRMAIGADRSRVLRLVLRQGLVLSLSGIGFGIAISLLVAKGITAGFAGMGKPNLATFIVAPLAMLAVTMAACWFPARRAAKVDPIKALRFE